MYSNYIESKVVYEAWRLGRDEEEEEHLQLGRRSWYFLGFRYKEHFSENSATGLWVDPIIKSDDELKEDWEVIRDGGILTPEGKAINDVFLSSMPRSARKQVLFLVQDRQRSSTNIKYSRRWELLGIRAVPHHVPVGWFGSWWKSQPEALEWEFVLKGETIDKTVTRIPQRYGNPFRKPLVGRGRLRNRSPIERRVVDRTIERYPRYETREVYVESRSVSPVPLGRRYPARRQRDLVGEPTLEEADKKLREILMGDKSE